MKTTTVLRLGLLALVIALALFFVPGAEKLVWAQTGRVIDTFTGAQTIIQVAVGSTFRVYTGTTANIIGAQREVTVEVTYNYYGDPYRMAVYIDGGGAGLFSQSQEDGVRGKTTIVYDGTNDGGAPGVDPAGLSNVDLDAYGENAIALLVKSSDHPGTVTITYYTYNQISQCSSQTKTLPSTISTSDAPRVILFPYSGFSSLGPGCSGLGNKDNVGAIVIVFDGSAESAESWDVTVDLLTTAYLDYGDLPTSPNYTSITTGTNAAGHVIVDGGLKMGSLIDTETDGQQNAGDALKDDQTNLDDEDGVSMLGTQWNAGSTNTARVNVAGGNGCVAAWIDWNDDGDFDDTVGGASENIITNRTVTTGNTDISFNVPSTQGTTGAHYSRWRLYPRDSGGTCTTTKSYQYQAYNGEVEDHYVGYQPTVITLVSFTQSESLDLTIPIVGLGVLGALGAVALARRRK